MGESHSFHHQVPVYPLYYRSSFLCPTLVNPDLVDVGHRVCGGP